MLLVLGEAEVPVEQDVLALGVADDALPVAPELGIVAGQQHEAGQHPGPELLDHLAVAEVAVDLPVRRHRAQVDHAGVPDGRLGGWVGDGHADLRSVRPGDATGPAAPAVGPTEPERAQRRRGATAVRRRWRARATAADGVRLELGRSSLADRRPRSSVEPGCLALDGVAERLRVR